MDQQLFIGVLPGGITYCDKHREVDGDYQRIAFLAYDTLQLQVELPLSPLLPEVCAHAAKVQAMKGQRFETSTSGQYVVLGAKANA